MFNPNLENTFVMFGTSHLVAFLIVMIIVFLVYRFRYVLKQEKYFNKFRYGFFIFAVTQEIILHIYRVVDNDWTFATSLPLQLCSISIFISSFVLLTKSKKLFTSTVFISMIGATLAMVTPGIYREYGFPHYRFFQFFMGHGMIVVNLTFALFVMGYIDEIKYKHLLHNLAALIVIAIFNYIINVLTGGNYLYLMGKPKEGSLFDLFGDHPWYLLNIFIFGIPIFFHLFYLPIFIRGKNTLKQT